MGQRLNVEIVAGDRLLANCCMHWSAYTGSAMEIGKIIIAEVKKFAVIIDTPKLAVSLLKASLLGALPDEETIRMLDLPTNKSPIDRNRGIISATEQGMKSTRFWEEGRITIDTIRRSVVFQNWYLYDLCAPDMPEERLKDLLDGYDLIVEKVTSESQNKIIIRDTKDKEKIFNLDLDFDVVGEISFENFLMLESKYKEMKGCYYFTINNKYFVSKIE